MADAPPPSSAPAPAPAKRSWKRRIRLIGIPVAVIVVSLIAFLHGGRYISTDDAYVKASLLTVSAEVAGTVVDVGVHENDVVAAGQLLYRIDDEPYRVALAGAEAQLAAVRADVEVLRATYRQKVAEAEQAETEAAFFRKEYDRVAPLVATNAATPSQVDTAQRNLSSAEKRLTGLREEASATLANLGGALDTPTDDHARVREAMAQRDLAKRSLARTRVTAPSAGVVSHTDALRPGLYLAAGAPAMALVESDELWVEASPKETDLTHVRVGQPAEVTVDAYPGHAWRGSVGTISPAAGSQFALLPAQNANGNWVKVVQRIPVRIALERTTDAAQLRAGMSVTASIDTGYRRTLRDLLRGIGGWFGLG